ncbi:MAG: hypothetical protein WCV90_04340 [Candidatus Woesearchaeota archaeon]
MKLHKLLIGTLAALTLACSGEKDKNTSSLEQKLNHRPAGIEIVGKTCVRKILPEYKHLVELLAKRLDEHLSPYENEALSKSFFEECYIAGLTNCPLEHKVNSNAIKLEFYGGERYGPSKYLFEINLHDLDNFSEKSSPEVVVLEVSQCGGGLKAYELVLIREKEELQVVADAAYLKAIEQMNGKDAILCDHWK